MRPEGESHAAYVARLLAEASGVPEVGEAAAQSFASSAPELTRTGPVVELGPEARRAVRDAYMRRMAALAEEAQEPPPGKVLIVAPGRLEAALVPRARPSRRREKFEASLRASGRGAMRLADWDGQIMGQAARIASSPRRCVEELARLPRELARRAHRACMEVGRRADPGSRGWGSITARRTLAYGVAIYRSSRRTKARGMASVAVGISVGMICALVRNPQTGAAYSRSAVSGLMRDGKDAAPLRALHEAGFFRKVQPPASVAGPSLCGRDRDGNARALNQYWFTEAAAAELEDAPSDEAPPRGPRRGARARKPRPPDREP